MGEPAGAGRPRRRAGIVEAVVAYFSPLTEFLRRRGALVVLAFVLIHKIGDTLANLTLRLLFEDLGFTNDEVAFYDVGDRLRRAARGRVRGRRDVRVDGHEASRCSSAWC